MPMSQVPLGAQDMRLGLESGLSEGPCFISMPTSLGLRIAFFGSIFAMWSFAAVTLAAHLLGMMMPTMNPAFRLRQIHCNQLERQRECTLSSLSGMAVLLWYNVGRTVRPKCDFAADERVEAQNWTGRGMSRAAKVALAELMKGKPDR